MFHFTRRIRAVLPLTSLLAGFVGSLPLLVLPSALILAFLVVRHLRIVGLVGVAPWASVGFARHVMVDDLARLAFYVALSPVPYLAGAQLRSLIALG